MQHEYDIVHSKCNNKRKQVSHFYQVTGYSSVTKEGDMFENQGSDTIMLA